MSEKKQSVEEVMQKIDQLLDVLKDISQDLADISKALKTARAPSPAPYHCSGADTSTNTYKARRRFNQRS
jgi:conjugal transfer/entry exclusion protein